MQPKSGVPLSPITGVPGWEEDIEEEVLSFYAAHVPAGGIIVELGAEYGRSAATFCRSAKPDVMIVSTDLFPYSHPEVGDLLVAYIANLRAAGFEGRTTAHRCDSAEAGKAWNGGPIDLLFVDADHTYDAVVRDIRAWEGHIRPNGIIAFHDCANGEKPHELHMEVSLAVDEWAARAQWEYMGQWASLRVYRRPS